MIEIYSKTIYSKTIKHKVRSDYILILGFMIYIFSLTGYMVIHERSTSDKKEFLHCGKNSPNIKS